jgi:carbamoyl-phosphate synthase large subunit
LSAVLFTCAGQRVDIVTAFGRAGAETVAADVNPLAPALYAADRHFLAPRIDDPGYVPALVEAVARHGVELVVPLTDLDMTVLAERRGELGALVLLPGPEVAERTNDKYETHLFLQERGIGSPSSWLPGDLPAELPYPVLVKARRGFGSRNIFRAENREELDFFLARTRAESFVQEACAGEEFSMDVFCDLEGRCLNSIPRTMIESKGGESIKGMTIADDELIALGRDVSEAIGVVGPATVQCFRAGPGDCKVTDVNLRFGGAFPLPLAAGSEYPALALALARGEKPEPRVGEFKEGVVMTRFFSETFLLHGDDGSLARLSQ